MNKCRLEALCKVLDKLPPKRFDYSKWVGDGWQGKPDLSCGTSACALGWATTIPSLRRAGLRLSRCRLDGVFTVTVKGMRRRSDDSLRAAEKIFSITSDEAHYLFIPSSYDGERPNRPGYKAKAKTVARHIRRFIERGGLPGGDVRD